MPAFLCHCAGEMAVCVCVFVCVCVDVALNGRNKAIPLLLLESIKSPPSTAAVCASVCLFVCVCFLTNALYRCTGRRALGLKGTFVCLLVHVCKCTKTGGVCVCVRACVCVCGHSCALRCVL